MDSRAALIWPLVEPVAADHGLEVLDIEIAGGANQRILRVYLDATEEGRSVAVGDCQVVSRQLGDVLEAHEAMSGRYLLEVSSPGFDRPLRKPEHFRRVIGERVRIRLVAEVDGRRNIVGRLVAADDDSVEIVDDAEETFRFALADLDRANVQHRFEKKRKPGRKR